MKKNAQIYLAKGNTGMMWHKLGHLNRKSMALLKEMSIGLSDSLKNNFSCKDCIKEKHVKDLFNVSKKRFSHHLKLVYLDLYGPMEEKSIEGNRYFLTFIDDFSRYIFVYILTHKNQVTETFLKFKNMAERQIGEKLKILRTDNSRVCQPKTQEELWHYSSTDDTIYPITKRSNGASKPLHCRESSYSTI